MSPRMHFKNAVHFITNRTEHQMFFLLPTKTITKLIRQWFARALKKYGNGLEIYAFIFLSNHFHLLVKDTGDSGKSPGTGGNLAAFMCYFQGNLARAVNRELGRSGTFWSGEYDDVIVEGDAELLNRYAYTLCNAVKAGLVDTADEWPGWTSLQGALSDGTYRIEMVNRTKVHNATRRGQKVDKSKFEETWTFKLTLPPFLEGKTKDERRQFIKDLLKTAEAAYRERREYKPPLGVPAIRKQRPTDRPKNPSFRPRIKVFILDEQRRREWLEGYRTFVGAYREAFDVYRKAAYKRRRPAIEWPDGSYPPGCWTPVRLKRLA